MVAVHQIGEVSEVTGLSLRTLRHWDEMGVVVPGGRSPGGFRLYTDSDIERVRFAMRLRPLELSLDEIRTLLNAYEVVSTAALTSHEDGEAAREVVASIADRTSEKIAEYTKTLRGLRELERDLRSYGSITAQPKLSGAAVSPASES